MTRALLGTLLSLAAVIALRSLLTAPATRFTLGQGLHPIAENEARLPPLTTPRIPRTLLFTHKAGSLEQLPPPFLENVRRTVRLHRETWADDNRTATPAAARYLNDSACVAAIARAEPRLVPHFRNSSTAGKFRADICRVAYLYLRGGYYFDVDMVTVQALRLPNNVTFASAVADTSAGAADPHGVFFQSLLASAPRHPVLRRALGLMLGYYNGTLPLRQPCVGNIVGPCTLRQAYDDAPARKRGVVRLLRESNLDAPRHRHRYPGVPRQRGDGCCCNFAVHDDAAEEMYFFSRVVGAGEFCKAMPEVRHTEADTFLDFADEDAYDEMFA